MQAAPRLSPPSWGTPPPRVTFLGLRLACLRLGIGFQNVRHAGQGDHDRPSGKIITWPHRAEDAPMFCGADVTGRCKPSPRKPRRALAPVHRPASPERHLSLFHRGDLAARIGLRIFACHVLLPSEFSAASETGSAANAGLPHPQRRQGSLRRSAQAPRRAAAIRLRPPRFLLEDATTGTEIGVPLVNDGPACADAPTPAVELLQLARLKFESRSDRQE